MTCGYTNVQVNGSDARSTRNHVNISTIHFLNTKAKHKIGSMTLYIYTKYRYFDTG